MDKIRVKQLRISSAESLTTGLKQGADIVYTVLTE